MTQNIQQLDPNFAAKQADDGLNWIDIRTLTMEGWGWPGESDAFCRVPDRSKGVVTDAVWQLSRHSSGLSARFVTDATRISARWKVRFESLAMAHMPSTGVSGLDLYVDDHGRMRWLANGRPGAYPSNESQMVDNIHVGTRLFELYLPLYNGVESVELGFPRGCNVRPAPVRTEKSILFYGTSIVQGGCASRPGMAYPAILSRRLERPHYNFGFSGNGRAEVEMAHLFRELDVAAYVLDPLPNLQEPQVTQRIEPFVRALREKRPRTPIILVENIVYQNAFLSQARSDRYTSSNIALRAAYERLIASGVDNLLYVPGDNLLGSDGEATVDGTHMTDLGFTRTADVLEPVIRAVL